MKKLTKAFLGITLAMVLLFQTPSVKVHAGGDEGQETLLIAADTDYQSIERFSVILSGVTIDFSAYGNNFPIKIDGESLPYHEETFTTDKTYYVEKINKGQGESNYMELSTLTLPSQNLSGEKYEFNYIKDGSDYYYIGETFEGVTLTRESFTLNFTDTQLIMSGNLLKNTQTVPYYFIGEAMGFYGCLRIPNISIYKSLDFKSSRIGKVLYMAADKSEVGTSIGYANIKLMPAGSTPASRPQPTPPTPPANNVYSSMVNAIASSDSENEKEIEWTDAGTSLPIDVMRALQNNQGISFKFTFDYEGQTHTVLITSENAIADDSIQWYGPAWLLQTYGEYSPEPSLYTVQRGDSLLAIANKLGTTVAKLLELNPQIKNPNVIYVGQVIKY